MEVGPIRNEERDELRRLFVRRWGSERMVSRGRLHEPLRYPILVARHRGRLVGALSYEIRDDEMQAVTVDAFARGLGAGGALLDAAADEARRRGCGRLWLITTNDNTPALRFYQRHGMSLVALHRGALAESRRLKPEIPAVGLDGIPLTDELELELRFGAH
ncbi:MAG TPA: GNAT family N-acetyltransferase [Thermoleophilaceae bacterium]|nr:GNAT family N-acetyltransferase [Thermoleophilaceae bacterium]